MKLSRHTLFLLTLAALVLAAMACVRSAPLGEGEDPLAATEKAASTADAEVQATLDALLGSATVESAAATVAPTNTATPQPATATATLEQAQLTALSASLTAAAATPEPTLAAAEDEDEDAATSTPTPQATSNACYGARYVYDESYPDGTRVDPGQSIVKTWRLQNVGTCDWRGGTYELIFSAGDRMGGTTPLTINITVPAGGYANFSVNLRAPSDPGTYHGDWLLRFDGDEVVGVGPDFNLPFWVEVIVRGATQTP
jgi:hypothetical protein